MSEYSDYDDDDEFEDDYQDYDDDPEDYDELDDFDDIPEFEYGPDEPYDDYEPEPDLENDRYSIWDSRREEYMSVFEVSRLRRWLRYAAWYWSNRVHAPLYRAVHAAINYAKPCPNCGKRGRKQWWFSDECSIECSKARFEKRVKLP